MLAYLSIIGDWYFSFFGTNTLISFSYINMLCLGSNLDKDIMRENQRLYITSYQKNKLTLDNHFLENHLVHHWAGLFRWYQSQFELILDNGLD